MQHVPGFLPCMLFRRPPLLAQYVNLVLHLYCVAVQNLVYGCETDPQASPESSDTPLIRCVQHSHLSIDMFIQLPVGLQCNPVQMAKLRQQVQDSWDNLSQDDIQHLYDHKHARIHACIDARD